MDDDDGPVVLGTLELTIAVMVDSEGGTPPRQVKPALVEAEAWRAIRAGVEQAVEDAGLVSEWPVYLDIESSAFTPKGDD